MSITIRNGRNFHIDCDGFTLIEVLVAVVVLALGTLGLASLQIVSMRSNFEATQRTQATVLANAVLDRMRANSEMLAVYASTDLGGNSITEAPSDSCIANEAEQSCMQKIANRDRWELEQFADNSDTLVGARICITTDIDGTGNPGKTRVEVVWRGVSETVNPPPEGACGREAIGVDFYKQVSVDTYIVEQNPY